MDPAAVCACEHASRDGRVCVCLRNRPRSGARECAACVRGRHVLERVAGTVP